MDRTMRACSGCIEVALAIAMSVTEACGGRAPAVSPSPTSTAAADTSIQAYNNRMVQQVLARVGDRQNLPASQVFENISAMPNTPVRVFLTIMNEGYARALGVRCTHCHVEGNFASDDKRPKRAARQMAAMHRMINQQLQAMSELALPPQSRFINCSTCHRGMINPLAEPARPAPRG